MTHAAVGAGRNEYFRVSLGIELKNAISARQFSSVYLPIYFLFVSRFRRRVTAVAVTAAFLNNRRGNGARNRHRARGPPQSIKPDAHGGGTCIFSAFSRVLFFFLSLVFFTVTNGSVYRLKTARNFPPLFPPTRPYCVYDRVSGTYFRRGVIGAIAPPQLVLIVRNLKM